MPMNTYGSMAEYGYQLSLQVVPKTGLATESFCPFKSDLKFKIKNNAGP